MLGLEFVRQTGLQDHLTVVGSSSLSLFSVLQGAVPSDIDCIADSVGWERLHERFGYSVGIGTTVKISRMQTTVNVNGIPLKIDIKKCPDPIAGLVGIAPHCNELAVQKDGLCIAPPETTALLKLLKGTPKDIRHVLECIDLRELDPIVSSSVMRLKNQGMLDVSALTR